MPLFEAWPRWVVMWLMAGAVFYALKTLTWFGAPRRGGGPAGAVAYFCGWVGLNPSAFLRRVNDTLPRRGQWVMAGMKAILGALLLWGLAPQLLIMSPLFGGWAGMIGLIFLLHFGIFELMALAWRARGRAVEPIMRAPILATSVTEFWAERWNRAFHDVVSVWVFRPCARRIGTGGAMLLTFLASGLIHDLMISVPAGAGYGLPTLYFLLQGFAIVMERSDAGREWGLGLGVRGWLFTAVVTAAPALLLFHPPFVLRVIVPFMRAIGAG